MAYIIRDFREDDAPALGLVTREAIVVIGAHAYTPEQVDVWASRHHDATRFVERAGLGHAIWVVVDHADAPVAYALLEPDGHLDMLYCHPDHTRRGLAGELLAHAEMHARGEGLERLYTEASELARPAFERAGYGVTQRRDFEIEGRNGPVAIHNYAMEKRLV